jgi:hypothetical protein
MRYLILLVLLFTSCTEFKRNADQIDDDMIRSIEFSYENPELKPGDTATLYATFAGEAFNLQDISWSVSWDIFTDFYGTNVIYDKSPFTPLPGMTIDSTGNSQMVKIQFVIPDLVIRNSQKIPDQWKQAVFMYGVETDSIAPEFWAAIAALPDDKNEMIDLIEAMMENPDLIPLEMKELIEPICQLFTVDFNIYANGVTDYEFKKTHVVRYTSGFPEETPVYLDKKPLLDTIFLYHLLGDVIDDGAIHTYDVAQIDTFANGEDTIVVPFEDGKHYNLMFPQKKDTTLSINEALKKNSSTSLEQFEWMHFTNGGDTDITLLDNDADVQDSLYSFLIEGEKNSLATTFWIKTITNRFGVVGWPSSTASRELTIISNQLP